MREIFIKEQYFRVKYDRPSKRGFLLFRVADGTDFFVEDMRDAEKIRSLFYPGIDDIAGCNFEMPLQDVGRAGEYRWADRRRDKSLRK